MKNLYESLLDDFEEISKSQDKEIISKWCEENLSGKYNAVILKNNSIKLRGDVLIKNYKESTFPYPISTMNGNLAIEKCPNITSLDGIPCTTCSFIDVHIVAGKPLYPKKVASALFDFIILFLPIYINKTSV